MCATLITPYGLQMTDQVSSQLARIQKELGQIVDERIHALEMVLQNSERMTRRLIKAEMELEHLSSNDVELQAQANSLEAQVAAARSRCEQMRNTHSSLVTERDTLKETHGRLGGEVTALREEVEQLRDEVGTVENEANSLRNENTALRTKAKTLEENVIRMRQLKDELMSSISGLTQQMSGLAGGESE